ncbi:MAG: hypothetical protein PHR36_01545, partial [Patescibacteria group bacterium]|nr:hypothetical protein [Patescibacteria group bacterium]
NMSFILILLVISFATILRVESYSLKTILPKLLIMAILINFSKTIFGLLIDFSQVIMLTFANSFKEGGGWFINMFRIDAWSEVSKISAAQDAKNWGADTWGTALAVIAGVIAAIITLVIVAAVLAVLVMRIVMLWIYTILSPLVFLGFAFPPLQKYTGQIWEDFTKQLVIGPVLAFFLWLSLTTASDSSSALYGLAATNSDDQLCVGIGAFFCEKNLQSFIIVIGLVLGGLMVSQQMGGFIAKAAGSGTKLATGGLKFGGDWAGRKFALFKGFEYGKPDEETGETKRIFRGFEVRPWKIYAGVKESLKDKAADEEADAEAKAGAELREGRLLGALGASRDFTEAAAHGFLYNKAWRPGEKGVISSTIRAKQAGKKIKELEKEKRAAEREWDDDPDNTAKMDKVEEINKKIATVKKENEKYKAPYTFYADAKRMEIINDQAKKLGDNDNEEDLVEKFNDAIRQGQKNLASAIVLHAAKVGHSNEVLEMIKVKEDVINDKGKTVSSKDKGDTFTADNAGLKGMFNQYFIKELGMNRQEALAIQSQFSVLAKKANHYNLSESVGTKNGLLVQRDDATQMARAVGEMMKVDVERLLRQFNRLGHGGEIQYNIGGEDKRLSDFNQQAESAFFKLAASWHQEVIDRQRFNMNYAQNLYNTYKVEREIEGVAGYEPNKDLKEAITGPFKSILTSVKDSGNIDEKYIDKTGEENTYGQLALETLRYGQKKYEAAVYSDYQARIAQEKNKDKKKMLEAELEKEKAIGKALEEEITKQLEAIPEYVAALKKRNKNPKMTKEKVDDYPG